MKDEILNLIHDRKYIGIILTKSAKNGKSGRYSWLKKECKQIERLQLLRDDFKLPKKIK